MVCFKFKNCLRRAPCKNQHIAARLLVILILEQCLQMKAFEWYKFIAKYFRYYNSTQIEKHH